jgi:hypothetical protein
MPTVHNGGRFVWGSAWGLERTPKAQTTESWSWRRTSTRNDPADWFVVDQLPHAGRRPYNCRSASSRKASGTERRPSRATEA